MRYLLLALCWLPLCTWADSGLPTQPYIYVEGKAEVERPADLVTLTFEVSAQDVAQAKANQLVQEKAAKVLTLLKDTGIADSDIVAVDVSLDAEFEETDEPPYRRGKLIGYKASRPFSVKVADLNKFPKLVNDLMALPVDEFDRIEEGLAEPKKLQDEVWAKAMTDAHDRAEKALAAAGLKLGSVYAISPVTFPEITRRIFEGGGNTRHESKKVVLDKVVEANYRLRPISITQSVHVIYLIRPKLVMLGK